MLAPRHYAKPNHWLIGLIDRLICLVLTDPLRITVVMRGDWDQQQNHIRVILYACARPQGVGGIMGTL